MNSGGVLGCFWEPFGEALIVKVSVGKRLQTLDGEAAVHPSFADSVYHRISGDDKEYVATLLTVSSIL